jgi:hypothetical protein
MKETTTYGYQNNAPVPQKKKKQKKEAIHLPAPQNPCEYEHGTLHDKRRFSDVIK